MGSLLTTAAAGTGRAKVVTAQACVKTGRGGRATITMHPCRSMSVARVQQHPPAPGTLLTQGPALAFSPALSFSIVRFTDRLDWAETCL